MIDGKRFIARSTDREAWLAARADGVTATMVAEAATPAGFDKVIRSVNEPVEPNRFMAWGVEREPVIAMEVKARYPDVLPNDWLIRHEKHEWAMATPDGLSTDHKTIAEIKTTGQFFATIPARYLRQVQWQLYVTGAEKCVFAFEERLETPEGLFVPGMDVTMRIVERDEKLIGELVGVAERLMDHFTYESQVD